MKALKFDVFGHQVLIASTSTGWLAFYLGSEGKRRSAPDIVVPPEIPESEIAQYLDDLCHEWATERHPSVRRLK